MTLVCVFLLGKSFPVCDNVKQKRTDAVGSACADVIELWRLMAGYVVSGMVCMPVLRRRWLFYHFSATALRIYAQGTTRIRPAGLPRFYRQKCGLLRRSSGPCVSGRPSGPAASRLVVVSRLSLRSAAAMAVTHYGMDYRRKMAGVFLLLWDQSCRWRRESNWDGRGMSRRRSVWRASVPQSIVPGHVTGIKFLRSTKSTADWTFFPTKQLWIWEPFMVITREIYGKHPETFYFFKIFEKRGCFSLWKFFQKRILILIKFWILKLKLKFWIFFKIKFLK